MRGEKKSEDRQQGPRRILGSDVKVSKTPPRRECAGDVERREPGRCRRAQRGHGSEAGGLGGMGRGRSGQEEEEEGQKPRRERGSLKQLHWVCEMLLRSWCAITRGVTLRFATPPFPVHPNLSLSF